MVIPLLISALFGLVVGSFVNVLALRVPSGESIRGRSRCPSCKNTLRWFELLPVVSYLLQFGRCRHCRVHISLQYPLVEVATAVFFALVASHFFPNWGVVVGYALVCALLVALFITDLRFGVLPDALTIPAILIALLTHFFGVGFPMLMSDIPVRWEAVVGFPALSMAIGGGFFALQWIVSRGRWVGSGDIRLGVVMGALLPVFPSVLLALLLAYISGALIAIVLLALGRVRRDSQIPFGVFLIPSTLVVFFWGGNILDWYFAVSPFQWPLI